MADITLTITTAGLDALVDAGSGATAAIEVTQIGLSESVVTVAPTLTALPGEFKRLSSFSGTSASATIIHMSGQDATTDTYDLRSIALYLADGTLFAAYSQATPIFSKVSLAAFLFAFDIAFEFDVSADIVFGDATFLYPPATEITKGVAEIATDAEASTGTDDERIITPKKLKTLLDVIRGSLTTVSGNLTALLARTITGSGLASGGGDLSASRTITVSAASGAETLARAISNKAVTPLGLASLISRSYTGGVLTIQLGDDRIQIGSGTLAANSTGSVTFPAAYTSECFFIAIGASTGTAAEGQVANTSNSLTTGNIVNSSTNSSSYVWLAIGK